MLLTFLFKIKTYIITFKYINIKILEFILTFFLYSNVFVLMLLY